MKFLDAEWLNHHKKKIKQNASNRYTPELNVELPIGQVFNSLCRDKLFYTDIRTRTGKLFKEFRHISTKYDVSALNDAYQNVSKQLDILNKQLSKIKEYSGRNIAWSKIASKANKCLNACWKLSGELYKEGERINKEKGKSKKDLEYSRPFNNDLHFLRNLERRIDYFIKFSKDIHAEVSNKAVLLLQGEAGTGKTHLYCDIATYRLNSKRETILLFGEYFNPTKGFWDNVKQQLSLDNQITQQKFLSLLNDRGKINKNRSLIIIDALNETSNLNYWKKYIPKFTTELKKYPHLAITFSLRSGFENEVLSKNQRESLPTQHHEGFRFREWEAITKFFYEFDLQLPEVPLLTPEFQNPLFLLLFCKAFKERSKSGKYSQVFKGHEGATFIFEKFIDKVSHKIEAQFGIDHGPKTDIWNTIIKPVANYMVVNHTDRIPEVELTKLLKLAHPTISPDDLQVQLEKNLILAKVPNYDKSTFDFRFPFQKFSDHLLARYFFKQFETEFGKGNKNLKTAKTFFSQKRKLGKFLKDSWNIGLVEALSVQCPEQLKGEELFKVVPYLNEYILKRAFLESLIWRKPTAFATGSKDCKKYLNENFQNSEDVNKVYDTLLSIASVPEHPFNAKFLHNHLNNLSLSQRDAVWSSFLQSNYRQEISVDRIINWGWSGIEKSHIKNEPLELFATTLCWLLTSSNRSIRDKATKALVETFHQRLEIIIPILELFKNVNDPYVLERIYAAVYGSLLISKSQHQQIKEIALWIFDYCFTKGNLPTHILTRDYARGIIKCALIQKQLFIDERAINPPYKSVFPGKIASLQELKKKYRPNDYANDLGYNQIWSSIIYSNGSLADFGRYVLGHAVDDWSNRKLKAKSISFDERLKKFKSNLSRKQLQMFYAAYPNQLRRTKSNSLSDTALMSKLTGASVEELTNYLSEINKAALVLKEIFESSLNKVQRYQYKRFIVPNLGNRGFKKKGNDKFDASFAERWVFQRTISLGYDPKIHKSFDNNLGGAREGGEVERIGKKYQWIALHEILALISDHFKFNDENSKNPAYEGPWQLYLRDIDPSCLLKDKASKKLEVFGDDQGTPTYNAWEEIPDTVNWLKHSADLPDPIALIQREDSQGNQWIMLSPSFTWEEETPPEIEKYDIPRRNLKYWMYSYLVKQKDAEKVFKWADQQWFFGDWMPRSHEFTNIFLGEYPSHPAFIFHNIPYYNHDGWTNYGRSGHAIPGKIILTDDIYSSSGSDRDKSTEHTLRVNLPAKYLVDEMRLQHLHNDGRFFDFQGELVAFDPYHVGLQLPQCVMFRKDKLINFATKHKMKLFWILAGEKIIIGSHRVGQPFGWLEITGFYNIDKSGIIKGQLKSRFKKQG